jgi:hypothetical protein
MRVITFRYVWRTATPRIVFPGYVFGSGHWGIQRHAYVFCAPTGVGGTHPMIFEAMAAGNCVLVNDHRPNAETVGNAALLAAVCEGSGPGVLLDSLRDREGVVLA